MIEITKIASAWSGTGPLRLRSILCPSWEVLGQFWISIVLPSDSEPANWTPCRVYNSMKTTRNNVENGKDCPFLFFKEIKPLIYRLHSIS